MFKEIMSGALGRWMGLLFLAAGIGKGKGNRTNEKQERRKSEDEGEGEARSAKVDELGENDSIALLFSFFPICFFACFVCVVFF